MRAALKAGARLAMGIDHPSYQATTSIGDPARAALVKDLSA
jgi:hypothetical protein